MRPQSLIMKKKDKLQGINIRLDSQDHSLIDRAAKRIADITIAAGGIIVGPIPLHVKKIKLEEISVRKHRRRLVITNPTPKLLETLATLEVPTGVNISLKIED
jgi:small subunit ribosomal protein S10